MQTKQLLKILNDRKIYPYLDDGKLKTRSMAKVIEPELVKLIKENKESLMQFLAEYQSAAAPASQSQIPLAAEAANYPLSHGQRALWFIHQLEGSTHYHLSGSLDAKGTLDLTALNRSLTDIISRHSVLRTVFEEIDGEPRQRILPLENFQSKYVDLTAETQETQQQKLTQHSDALQLRPFDLSKDVMLRVAVYAFDNQHHQISFVMHHIASDGWSNGLLVRELQAFYQANIQNKPAALPPLKLQYKDFAAWQSECMKDDVVAKDLAFWRENLKGLPVVHSLPLDYSRPKIQDFNGDTVTSHLSSEVLAGLKTLARQHDASLFMVLHALYAVLLARWSNQTDIVIAVPSGGRLDKNLEPLIGYFINTLVMRSSIGEEMTFSEWFQASRQNTLNAFNHQDVPLELLIDDLRPARSLSHNPLCQVKFVLQNYVSRPLELDDLTLSQVAKRNKKLRFDLDLTATETENGLQLQWNFQTALFSTESIQQVAGWFEELVNRAVNTPDADIWTCSLVSEQTAAQTLALGVGATRTDTFADIVQHVEGQANRNSSAIATQSHGLSFTYGALQRHSQRLANYMLEMGVEPGEPIGVLVKSDALLPAVLLGLLQAGVCYVPLASNWGQERCNQVVEDAGIELVVAHSDLMREVDISGVDLILADDGHQDDWLAAYDGPVSTSQPISSADTAYIIYTSGSSGKPKGVVVSHGAMMDYLQTAKDSYFGSADATLALTHYVFDMTVPALFLPFLNGARGVFPAEADILSFMMQELTKDDALNCVLRMTPMHVRGLLNLLPEGTLINGHHKFVIGGEVFQLMLARELQQRCPNSVIYNHYGPSETVVGCTMYNVSDNLATLDKHTPIGQAFPNTWLYVLDKHANLAAPGAIGELHVGGACLSDGYLGQAEMTASRFIANPFKQKATTDPQSDRIYATGDLVRWDHNGQLEYIERADQQVKLRGYRIEIPEIEIALQAAPGVSAGRVILKGKGEQARLLAYVVADSDQQSEKQFVEQVQQHLEKRLPNYMQPSAVAVLDALPLNVNGKLDTNALPDITQEEEQFTPPASGLESQIARIWCDILGLDSISANGNFFKLGGHSMLATQLISTLMTEFSIKPEVKLVFEHPVLTEFATALTTQYDAQNPDSSAVAADAQGIAIQEQAFTGLSHHQKRLWVIHTLEDQGYHYNVPMALKISGSLNVTALQDAILAVVQRHSILRTNYIAIEGQGVAVVADSTDYQTEIVDFSQSDDPHAQARTLAEQEARVQFDLATDVMFRSKIVIINKDEQAGEYLLLMTTHHIAFDGWSKQVLARELEDGYRLACNNTSVCPPAQTPEHQYSDFAAWQHDVQAQQSEAMREYWLSELQDAPATHSIPLDKPRQSSQNFSGGRHQIQLSEATSQALEKLANDTGSSLFMVLEALFALMIGRWSYSEDVLIGTPVSGREHPDTHPLIGFFVNTLVLRHRLDKSLSLRDYLVNTQKQILTAFSHQDYPFEAIVDDLQLERSLSHSPLFQVVFSLKQKDDVSSLNLDGSFVEMLHKESSTAKFDLELIAQHRETGIELNWIYANSLFSQHTIARMAQAFCTLADAAVAAPDSNAFQLPMLTAQQQLSPATTESAQSAFNLYQMLDNYSRTQPDAVALVTEDLTRRSYAQLDTLVNAFAAELNSRGVQPGQHVGIYLPRSEGQIICMLAILKLGAVYVPLDANHPQSVLAQITEDCHWVVTDSTSDGSTGLAQEHHALAVPEGQMIAFNCDNTEVAALPVADVAQTTPACIFYTSGTTGKPKAVPIGHHNIKQLVWQNHAIIQTGQNMVVAHNAGFAFDATTMEVWGALLNGACLQFLPGNLWEQGEGARQFLREHQVSWLFLTTALFNTVAKQNPGIFEGLDHVAFGGEAVDNEAVNTMLSSGAPKRLSNFYGPTENTVVSTAFDISDASSQTYPIGRAIPGTRCMVVDTAGQPVAPGGSGELWVAGTGLSQGYLYNEALNQQKFVDVPEHGRFYRTGDLVRADKNGNYVFLGRIDKQVKIRGMRVDLEAVNSVLSQHPALTASVVVMSSLVNDKRLVAYVVAKSDANSNLAPTSGPDSSKLVSQLRAYLLEKVPSNLVPSVIMPLSALPLTANGKINYKALPQPGYSVSADNSVSSHNTSGSGAETAPLNQLQKGLLDIWCKVLRLDSISIDDNFFEIGGDSILAIQLVSEGNKNNIVFSTKQLFAAQTVRNLAHKISIQSDANEDAFLGSLLQSQQKATGQQILLPIQQWYLEHASQVPEHFNQSVLLTPTTAVRASDLEKVVAALLAKHDALRLVFDAQQRSAQYREHCQAANYIETVQVENKQDISAICQHWQSAFSLDHGPLLKMVLIDCPQQQQRLFIVAHHLIIDAVSWRILLADLQTAWQQLQQSPQQETQTETPELTAPKASFQSWAEKMAGLADNETVLTQSDFWLEQLQSPQAGKLAAMTEADQQSHTQYQEATLDARSTSALLQQLPGSAKASIEELLLTAVYQAIAAWNDNASVLFEMENHGRSNPYFDAPLEQTIGWFTQTYPVQFKVNSDDANALLRGVKQQLRPASANAVSYGVLHYLKRDEQLIANSRLPDVTFNYLGQMDSVMQDGGAFTLATEPKGSSSSPLHKRRSKLGVRAQIVSGQLKLAADFSERQFAAQEVSRMLENACQWLQSLVQQCQTEQHAVLSSAWLAEDFPLATLQEHELQQLTQQHNDIEKVYPATGMQSGMLYHSEQDASAYVVQAVMNLSGNLNVDKLEQAWQSVAAQHDLLRTAFVSTQQGYQQVVSRQTNIPFEVLDWREENWETQQHWDAAFAQLKQQQKQQGFDLAIAPLMRLHLMLMPEQQYQLLWTYHHALFDGWSVPMLYQEILHALQQLTRNDMPEFQSRPAYEEYIHWLDTKDNQVSQDYWKHYLSGITQVAELPFKNLPGKTGHGVQRQSIAVSPELSHKLQQVTSKANVTMNTLLQVCWGHLLARYTGNHDVVFGATVSGRPQDLPGAENIIGCMINTIPVRVQIDRQPLVNALRLIQQQFQESLEHSHLPLADITMQSELEGGSGLFESLLVYENYPKLTQQENGNEDTAVTVNAVQSQSSSNYPLTLVASMADELRLQLLFQSSEVSHDEAQNVCAALHALLEGASDALLQPLRQAWQLPQSQQQLLSRHQDRRAQVSGHWHCIEQFALQVQKHPTKTCVSFADAQWNYQQLWQASNLLVSEMLAKNIGHGDVIALLLPRSAALIAAATAVLRTGAAYAIIDTQYPQERIEYMLKDSRARLLCTLDAQQQNASDSWSVDTLAVGTLLENLVLKESVIQSNSSEATGELTDAQLQKLSSVSIRPEDRALLYYTSGTTGQPKGVAVCHGNLQGLLQNPDYADLSSASVIAQAANASFDAFTFEVWGALVHGGTVVEVNHDTYVDPVKLAERINASGINTLFVTTAILNQVAQVQPDGFAPLQTLLFGGEAASLEAINKIIEQGKPQRFMHVYGPTETTTFASSYEIIGLQQLVCPIGAAINGGWLRVLDNALQPTPPGGIGDLYIGGSGVSLGYLNRFAQTRQSFVNLPDCPQQQRFYCTGDRVQLDLNGDLIFVGRQDSQTKLRGFRIELAEIQSQLLKLPEVRNAVVRIIGEGQHCSIAAWVVAEDAYKASSEQDSAAFTRQLLSNLQRQLPGYMVPQHVALLAHIPLNHNGKVDNAKLPAIEVGSGHYVAPEGETETLITEIWQQLLQLDQVSVTDNFFNLGGNSLLVTRMIAAIKAQLRVELNISDLFEYQTVRSLSEFITLQKNIINHLADEQDEEMETEDLEW